MVVSSAITITGLCVFCRSEAGNAGGRAFVSVRRPLMKRNSGDLEQQSGHGRQQRDHYHRIVRILRRDRARNDRQVGGGKSAKLGATGNSVERKKSVGKDAR